MHTNRSTGTEETNVPRTSLPCPPRYGNSTSRWFVKALGANHSLVYYRSGGGSTGLRQVRPPLLSHTILTRETGTRIHPYLFKTRHNFLEAKFQENCQDQTRLGIWPRCKPQETAFLYESRNSFFLANRNSSKNIQLLDKVPF